MWLCWLLADVELKLMRSSRWWRGVSHSWLLSTNAIGGDSSSLLGGAASSWEEASVSGQLLSRASSLLQTQEAQGHVALSVNINAGVCSLTALILPQDRLLFLSLNKLTSCRSTGGGVNPQWVRTKHRSPFFSNNISWNEHLWTLFILS